MQQQDRQHSSLFSRTDIEFPAVPPGTQRSEDLETQRSAHAPTTPRIHARTSARQSDRSIAAVAHAMAAAHWQ
jgi:hypothetical protein